MWKLYFYGAIVTPETASLVSLAACVRETRMPDDLEWFEMAPIEWEAVNRGYICQQFSEAKDRSATKPFIIARG